MTSIDVWKSERWEITKLIEDTNFNRVALLMRMHPETGAFFEYNRYCDSVMEV